MDYYNEIEPYAAAWLRNLIDAGHLPDGVVDTRSIEDVRPDELRQFRRCHFFAGIGVWALAIERAGWPADLPVWTGSCPCQPFSSAGKGAGFADERHLWPAWHHLIEQCRPPAVLGEQVASRDADAWVDLVQADMEALDYAFGAVPFPAASVGAPHIRDRLYWVADADGQGPQGSERGRERADAQRPAAQRGGEAGGLEHPRRDHDAGQESPAGAGQPQADRPANFAGGSGVSPCRVADTHGERWAGNARPDGRVLEGSHLTERDRGAAIRLVGGFWSNAEWTPCRDGKWRPIEPGAFPLAHGAAARVGRLRAYGNAIVAPQAEVFVRAYLGARAA